ncbi:DUF6397 family protein [Streptomyces sp. FIT100]|uniref:DUF6397 family protein n=1 Tax=Streptomyces sp. FIT100 TaxID=2837956 RepID=UPI0021C8A4C9|nr:DUF6397 family protein [Streptomyces sp. FIT100]UUN30848.1 hypothetical protein KK483_34310 [Streptomyces sp. FIT100]
MTDTDETTGTSSGLPETMAFGRAATALELKGGELDLAVQLGHVRAMQGKPPGRARVSREEIDRLRGAEGFPEALRERVRTVGTAEGARLISTTPGRFTRLARTGHVIPVRFYLNRYRAVVWLYLAPDLEEFAARNPDLLDGRLPAPLRARLDDGEDWRARNWRGRRLGVLLRRCDDPWERTAAIASLLDPVLVAETVGDPYERAHLERLRPEPPYARTESPAVREATDRLLRADDPDEIQWHRMHLGHSLEEARASTPAPRPDMPRPRPPRLGVPASRALGGTVPDLRPGSAAVSSGAEGAPAVPLPPRGPDLRLPAPPGRDSGAPGRHRAPTRRLPRRLLARLRLRKPSTAPPG